MKRNRTSFCNTCR